LLVVEKGKKLGRRFQKKGKSGLDNAEKERESTMTGLQKKQSIAILYRKGDASCYLKNNRRLRKRKEE